VNLVYRTWYLGGEKTSLGEIASAGVARSVRVQVALGGRALRLPRLRLDEHARYAGGGPLGQARMTQAVPRPEGLVDAGPRERLARVGRELRRVERRPEHRVTEHGRLRRPMQARGELLLERRRSHVPELDDSPTRLRLRRGHLVSDECLPNVRRCSSSSTSCQRSPSSSPRRRPVERATVVILRAAAYQWASSPRSGLRARDGSACSARARRAASRPSVSTRAPTRRARRGARRPRWR
jgi:hypothetical protein